MAVSWSDEYQEALCQWVRDHGLEPRDVPFDGVRFERDWDGNWLVEFDVLDRDENGELIIDRHSFARHKIRTAILREPPLMVSMGRVIQR